MMTLRIRSVRKKLLPTPRIGAVPRPPRRRSLGQRPDQLVDRRALLRSRGEIEAAQGGIGVIARRLENLIEEIEDRPLERAPSAPESRTAERDAFGAGSSCSRSSVSSLRRSSSAIELVRHLADQVRVLVGGLERRAPDLPPAGFAEIAEIFDEAGDQIGFGEQRIDRKVDLEPLMQLQQPRPDRVGMGRRFRPAPASSCLRG